MIFFSYIFTSKQYLRQSICFQNMDYNLKLSTLTEREKLAYDYWEIEWHEFINNFVLI